MDKKAQKALLTFQQGELNAVAMYKRLIELVKDDNIKNTLKTLCAEEGAHASIIKNVSGAVLKPKNTMKNAAVLGYRFLGRKSIFKVIASFEVKSAKLYRKYTDTLPTEVVAIADDEIRHANILRSL